MFKTSRTDTQPQPNVAGVTTGVLYFTALAAGVIRESVSWIIYGVYGYSENIVTANRRL